MLFFFQVLVRFSKLAAEVIVFWLEGCVRVEQAARPEVSLPSPFLLLQETVICFKVRFAALIENDCAKPHQNCACHRVT